MSPNYADVFGWFLLAFAVCSYILVFAILYCLMPREGEIGAGWRRTGRVLDALWTGHGKVAKWAIVGATWLLAYLLASLVLT